MLAYYPLLIESAIEFKIEARRILSERGSDFPLATDSVDNCAIAPGFQIVHSNNKYYCLRNGQDLQDRILEKQSVVFKPREFDKLADVDVANNNYQIGQMQQSVESNAVN